MATQVGVIKQVSGTVVAVDANGKERILTAGDAIFFGEIVKTIGNNSNAVIAMDGGKDVSILANDTVLIDQNILNIQNQNINTIADINDLQKAILAGKDLTQLEETAAGGGDTGSGDGVSLGEARFAEGGHESNIYAYGRNINDTHYAFATPINSVGGANSDNSNIKDVIVLDTFVSLSVELKTAEGNDNIITEKELHDGKDGEKIVGELVVGKDIVVDMTNDKIAISVDGRKIGDAKITNNLGNGKYEYELTNIRTEEFTDGTSNKPNGKIEAVYNAVDKQGNHKDVTANNIYEVEFSGPKQEDDPSKPTTNENGVYISVELKTAEGNDNIITEKELHDGKDGEKIVGELVVGKDIVVDMTNDKIAISVDGRKIGDAKITNNLGNGKYEYELTNIRTEEFTDGTSNKPNGKIEAVYNAVDKQGNHKDVTANNIYEVEFSGPKQEDDPSKPTTNENGVYISVELKTAEGNDNIITEKELHDGVDGEKIVGELVVGKDIVVDMTNDKIAISVDGRKIGDAKITNNLGNGKYEYELTNIRTEEFTDGTSNKPNGKIEAVYNAVDKQGNHKDVTANNIYEVEFSGPKQEDDPSKPTTNENGVYISVELKTAEGNDNIITEKELHDGKDGEKIVGELVVGKDIVVDMTNDKIAISVDGRKIGDAKITNNLGNGKYEYELTNIRTEEFTDGTSNKPNGKIEAVYNAVDKQGNHKDVTANNIYEVEFSGPKQEDDPSKPTTNENGVYISVELKTAEGNDNIITEKELHDGKDGEKIVGELVVGKDIVVDMTNDKIAISVDGRKIGDAKITNNLGNGKYEYELTNIRTEEFTDGTSNKPNGKIEAVYNAVDKQGNHKDVTANNIYEVEFSGPKQEDDPSKPTTNENGVYISVELKTAEGNDNIITEKELHDGKDGEKIVGELVVGKDIVVDMTNDKIAISVDGRKIGDAKITNNLGNGKYEYELTNIRTEEFTDGTSNKPNGKIEAVYNAVDKQGNHKDVTANNIYEVEFSGPKQEDDPSKPTTNENGVYISVELKTAEGNDNIITEKELHDGKDGEKIVGELVVGKDIVVDMTNDKIAISVDGRKIGDAKITNNLGNGKYEYELTNIRTEEFTDGTSNKPNGKIEAVYNAVDKQGNHKDVTANNIYEVEFSGPKQEDDPSKPTTNENGVYISVELKTAEGNDNIITEKELHDGKDGEKIVGELVVGKDIVVDMTNDKIAISVDGRKIGDAKITNNLGNGKYEYELTNIRTEEFTDGTSNKPNGKIEAVYNAVDKQGNHKDVTANNIYEVEFSGPKQEDDPSKPTTNENGVYISVELKTAEGNDNIITEKELHDGKDGEKIVGELVVGKDIVVDMTNDKIAISVDGRKIGDAKITNNLGNGKYEYELTNIRTEEFTDGTSNKPNGKIEAVYNAVDKQGNHKDVTANNIYEVEFSGPKQEDDPSKPTTNENGVYISVELKTAEGNDNIITEKELHDGKDGEKIVGELVVGKDIVVDMTNDKIAISVDGRKIGDAKITNNLGNGKYEYELTNIRTEEFTDGTSNKPNGKIEAVYNAVDKQGNHKDVTANNIYEVEFSGPKQEDDPSKPTTNENGVYISVELKTAEGNDNIITEKELHDGVDGEKIVGELVVGKDIVVDMTNDKIAISVDGRKIGDAKITRDLGNGKYEYELTNIRTEEFTDGTSNKPNGKIEAVYNAVDKQGNHKDVTANNIYEVEFSGPKQEDDPSKPTTNENGVYISVELKTAEGNDNIITEKELHDGKDGEKIVGELVVGKDIVVDMTNDKIAISVDGRKIGDAKITNNLGNGKYEYELTNIRTEEFTDGTSNKPNGKIEAVYNAVDKQGNHKDVTANNIYEVEFSGPKQEDDPSKPTTNENGVYISVELKTAEGNDNIITEKELHDGKDGEKIVGELVVGKDIVVDMTNDKIAISVDGRKIGDAKITNNLGNGKYEYELTNIRTEEFTDGTSNKPNGKIEAVYNAVDKQGNHKDVTANNIYEVEFSGPKQEDDPSKPTTNENGVYISVELKTAEGNDNIITEKELHDGKDGEKIVGELVVGKDIVVDMTNDKIAISVDGRKIGDAKITNNLGNGKYEYELTNIRTEEFTDGTSNKPNGKIEAVYNAVDKQGNHKDVTANNIYEVEFSGPKQEDDPSKPTTNENGVYISVELKTAEGNDNIITEKELHDGVDGEKIVGELVVGKDIVVDMTNDKIAISVDGRKIGDAKITNNLGNGKYEYELTNIRTEEFTDGTSNKPNGKIEAVYNAVDKQGNHKDVTANNIYEVEFSGPKQEDDPSKPTTNENGVYISVELKTAEGNDNIITEKELHDGKDGEKIVGELVVGKDIVVDMTNDKIAISVDGRKIGDAKITNNLGNGKYEYELTNIRTEEFTDGTSNKPNGKIEAVYNAVDKQGNHKDVTANNIYEVEFSGPKQEDDPSKPTTNENGVYISVELKTAEGNDNIITEKELHDGKDGEKIVGELVVGKDIVVDMTNDKIAISVDGRKIGDAKITNNLGNGKYEYELTNIRTEEFTDGTSNKPNGKIEAVYNAVDKQGNHKDVTANNIYEVEFSGPKQEDDPSKPTTNENGVYISVELKTAEGNDNIITEKELHDGKDGEKIVGELVVGKDIVVDMTNDKIAISVDGRKIGDAKITNNLGNGKYEYELTNIRTEEFTDGTSNKPNGKIEAVYNAVDKQGNHKDVTANNIYEVEFSGPKQEDDPSKPTTNENGVYISVELKTAEGNDNIITEKELHDGKDGEKIVGELVVGKDIVVDMTNDKIAISVDGRKIGDAKITNNLGNGKYEYELTNIRTEEFTDGTSNKPNGKIEAVYNAVDKQGNHKDVTANNIYEVEFSGPKQEDDPSKPTTNENGVYISVELKTAEGNDHIITEKELHDGVDGEKIVGELVVGKDIVVDMTNDKIAISVDGRKIGDAKITRDLGNGKYEYELTNIRTEEFTDGTSNKPNGKIEAVYNAVDKQGNHKDVTANNIYEVEFSGPKQEDDPSKPTTNENGVYISVELKTAEGNDNIITEKELHDGVDGEKIVGKLVVGKDIVVDMTNDKIAISVDGRKIGDAKITRDLGNGKYEYELTNIRTEEFTDGTSNKPNGKIEAVYNAVDKQGNHKDVTANNIYEVEFSGPKQEDDPSKPTTNENGVYISVELKTAEGNDNIITEKELHDGKDGEKIVGELVVGKDIVVDMTNDKIAISVDGRKIGDAKITNNLGNGKYEYELTNIRTEEFTDGTSNKPNGKIEAVYNAVDKQGNHKDVTANNIYEVEFSGPKQEDDPSKPTTNENGVYISVELKTAEGNDNIITEKELHDGKDGEKIVGELVVGKDIVVDMTNDKIAISVDGRKIGDAKITNNLGNGKYEYELTNIRTEEFTDGTSNKPNGKIEAVYNAVDKQGNHKDVTANNIYEVEFDHISIDAKVSLNVSEEGLPGGIKDNKGTNDTTNSVEDNKSINVVSASKVTFEFAVTDGANSGLKSGGEKIIWKSVPAVGGDGKSISIIGVKETSGETVLTVKLNKETGATKVVLEKPVDHDPAGNGEDVVTANLPIKATNAHGAIAKSAVEINIQDDSPYVASDSTENVIVGFEQPRSNVTLVLDFSRSMFFKSQTQAVDANGKKLYEQKFENGKWVDDLDRPVLVEKTRLEIAHEGVTNLLNQYSLKGDENVKVSMVAFAGDAKELKSSSGQTWMSISEAKALIDKYFGGDYIKYDKKIWSKNANGEYITDHNYYKNSKIVLDDDGNFILKVRGQGEYNISASVNLPIDDIKGGTNYDAALAQAKDTFAKNGKITGADVENRLHFVSDGEPTMSDSRVGSATGSLENRASIVYDGRTWDYTADNKFVASGTSDYITSNATGTDFTRHYYSWASGKWVTSDITSRVIINHGIDDAEKAVWENWLINNKVIAESFALGNDAKLDKLDPIAYDGVERRDIDAKDFAELALPTKSFKGNIMDTLKEADAFGKTSIEFGADGAGVQAVAITLNTAGGVKTYTYTPGENGGEGSYTISGESMPHSGSNFIATLPTGSKITIDMVTGKYEYNPNADLAKAGKEESVEIKYSVTDADGDSVSATTTINTNGIAGFDHIKYGTMNGDTLNGTSGNDAILGGRGDDYIDGKGGHDALLGGEGNDTIVYHKDAKILDGGDGSDTLVIKHNIDFSNISGLDGKVSNFERIDLGKGGTSDAIEMTIRAEDVLDITDNKNTILKIDGDAHDTVKGGNWKVTHDVAADSGYTAYEGTTEKGQTIYIQINNEIKTDF